MIVGIRQGVLYKSERLQLRPGEGLCSPMASLNKRRSGLVFRGEARGEPPSFAAQPLRSLVASVTEEARKFVVRRTDDFTTVRYHG